MNGSSMLRFVADSMLGTLAKKLRLLGIDTVYLNDTNDSELKYLARSQGRILLTKDKAFVRELPGQVWLVDGHNVQEEFVSIAGPLSAAGCQPDPFSRCLECNGPLETIEPSDAQGVVPPYICQTKKIFSRCPSCGKIFWEGTHSNRMEGEVQWMRGVLEEVKR